MMISTTTTTMVLCINHHNHHYHHQLIMTITMTITMTRTITLTPTPKTKMKKEINHLHFVLKTTFKLFLFPMIEQHKLTIYLHMQKILLLCCSELWFGMIRAVISISYLPHNGLAHLKQINHIFPSSIHVVPFQEIIKMEIQWWFTLTEITIQRPCQKPLLYGVKKF